MKSALLFASCLCACGANEAAESLDETNAKVAVVASDDAAVAGFVHSASRSRFHLGGGAKTLREQGLEKLVGSEGVIATNVRTGAVRAILNADSPAAKVPPYSSDAAVHNKLVVEYFQAAGLPAKQMGVPHELAEMEGDGPANDLNATKNAKFSGYITYVPRVVDGIPIPDSFAAARFNADGEVTMEWIYWPPIPRHVLDDAVQLRGRLTVETSKSAFLGRLPSEAQGAAGEVSIRHSDFDDERSFQAFASYDVSVPKGPERLRAATLNFSSTGAAMVHPSGRSGTNEVPTSYSKP